MKVDLLRRLANAKLPANVQDASEIEWLRELRAEGFLTFVFAAQDMSLYARVLAITAAGKAVLFGQFEEPMVGTAMPSQEALMKSTTPLASRAGR